jgi:hypothetical protein
MIAIVLVEIRTKHLPNASPVICSCHTSSSLTFVVNFSLRYKCRSYAMISRYQKLPFRAEAEFLSSPRRPDRLWGPPSLLSNGYQGVKRQGREADHSLPSSAEVGRAIVQAVSRRLPTAAARVPSQDIWDLWWTKWHWGRFSPSTLVSPANSHFTDYSTFIIYHPGLGTIGQTVADVPSGLILTPSQENKKKVVPRSSKVQIPPLPPMSS